MKKNWINSKRTKLASICEILCPIVLMAILSLARLAVKKQSYSESSQISSSVIYHPIHQFDTMEMLQNIIKNPNTTAEVIYSVLGDPALSSFYQFSEMQFNNSPPFTLLAKSCMNTSSNPARTYIAFAPNNSITQQVVAQIQSYGQLHSIISTLLAYQNSTNSSGSGNSSTQSNLSSSSSSKSVLQSFQYMSFNTGEEITAYLADPLYMEDDSHPGICFGFELIQNSVSDYESKLYFNDHHAEPDSQSIPSQLKSSYSNLTSAQDNSSYFLYAIDGYAHLQNLIANTVLKTALNNSNATIALTTVPFRQPAYISDSFSQIISAMLPFFMLLIYILPIRRMLQRIVSEKESKIRESMRMMGLNDMSYWLSWFVYYLIIVTLISILCLIILSINVVKSSNKFLLFLYLWIYGVSQFGFIVFIQCFFSKQRVAQIGGTLIYFGTSFVDQIVKDPNTSLNSKVWASLLSTVAVSRGAEVMGAYEVANIGVQFGNMNDQYQDYTFAWCLIMMTLSFVLFLSVGIYLDNVLPSAFGRRKPWYFCVSPSYWRGYSKKKQRIENKSSHTLENESQSPHSFELKYLKPDNYEPPAHELLKQEETQQMLKIEDLKKIFSNGFEAVKGLNVKMFTGQIFALLGHNGAGKTTTISMLTGLIEQSSGRAEVCGLDLFNDMNKVRSFLGVCPQHDVLFDLLTPFEHLMIFCDFKGVAQSTKQEECLKILKEVDLWAYRDTIAQNLSGGSRRKLSVAIALVGGSKLVLLDEPTSGMDLTARRKLWNMLKNQKNNRIIILTTHYMDEADILGDRIGIMAEGKLICLGSSLFLKNRFGVGYNLKIIKNSKEANFNIDKYLREKLGKDLKQISNVSTEMVYQIPHAYSDKFARFFEDFDKDLDGLDIQGYGISITTLEEVFLRVGHGENLDEDQKVNDDNFNNELEAAKLIPGDDNYCVADQHEVGIINVFTQNIEALFRKRFFMYKRSSKTFIVEIFIPILLVIIGLAFTKLSFFYNAPDRQLTPSLYPYKQRILSNQDLVVKSNYDISPQLLMGSLPDYDTAFDVTFNNYSSINTQHGSKAILEQFDIDVFDQGLTSPIMPYRYGSYFVYEANNNTKQYYVSTFINITSQDVTAIYPEFIYESILKQATGNPNFKFTTTTSPYPVSQRLKDRAQAANGLFVSFVIAIGFALIPTSIISFIINEREKNLKHMQLISGMNLPAYWISNYVFDIMKAQITMGIAIGLMYAFQVNYADVWTVFLMYPVGVIPFTYVTSFIFINEGIGQTTTIFANFVIAGIGSMVIYILRIISTTYAIGDNLMWVFKILPSFCLNNSIVFAAGKGQLKALRPTLDVDDFSIQNMGGDLLLMGIHFVLWTIILIVIESDKFNCLRSFTCRKKEIPVPLSDLDMDEDVLAEEKRVEDTPANMMNVRVNRFRKVYTTLFGQPFLAVERSSFGLDYGECFCLIGVNGAGKTTTFKSLTNDIVPTSGEITINGMNVTKEFSKVRKLIGYCPQYDVIFENMTVEEHLDYYARIKGILQEKRHELIEKKIVELNLSDHRNKTAQTLSGGNKRKLSVAMALIGNPPVIFLDEPSAGMDPQARRFMWEVISKVSKQQKKSAVILTTHSMEEVEALSDKLGIFVRGGKFSCFGSCQHIKDKFGTGYEIEAKIRRLVEEDLQEMASKYKLPPITQQITFAHCAMVMRLNGVNEFLVGELKENGLGNDLYKEAVSQNGFVNVRNFLTWLHVQTNGQKIIQALLADFKSVEILEHYNDYFKLKIQKMGKSIGYVFGFVEKKKQQLEISEYSVSQTTLEQIFQRFANVEVDAIKGMVFEEKAGKILIKPPQQYMKKPSLKEQNQNSKFNLA